MRRESTDPYPGDPQNGRDQFGRLLNSAGPITRNGGLVLATEIDQAGLQLRAGSACGLTGGQR
jgi:hypothetical protein